MSVRLELSPPFDPIKTAAAVAQDPIVQKRCPDPERIQQVVKQLAAQARITIFIDALAINTLRSSHPAIPNLQTPSSTLDSKDQT